VFAPGVSPTQTQRSIYKVWDGQESSIFLQPFSHTSHSRPHYLFKQSVMQIFAGFVALATAVVVNGAPPKSSGSGSGSGDVVRISIAPFIETVPPANSCSLLLKTTVYSTFTPRTTTTDIPTSSPSGTEHPGQEASTCTIGATTVVYWVPEPTETTFSSGSGSATSSYAPSSGDVTSSFSFATGVSTRSGRDVSTFKSLSSSLTTAVSSIPSGTVYPDCDFGGSSSSSYPTNSGYPLPSSHVATTSSLRKSPTPKYYSYS